jgi:DNA adenine methylase
MNRYPGGKNAEGTWQWAIGHMPSHAFYAELFAGSAGLYRRKVPAIRSVLCDRDSPIADYWRRHALPGTTVVHGCAIEWLKRNRSQLGHDWLIYLDPPYLPETRVKKKLYRHEMTREDHVRLLAVVLTWRHGPPAPRRLRGL